MSDGKTETTQEEDGWIQLKKCKHCGRSPLVIRISKEVKVIGCPHGENVDHLNGFGREEDWNNAQR